LKSKRILLIQLRQLGDILLTTPCIAAIKEDNSAHEIIFLCHDMGKRVLADNPLLHELWTYREEDSWYQQAQLFRRIRSEPFDLVIDFMSNPRSALFAFAARSPQKIAFHSRRSWFYTDTVPLVSYQTYIVREKFLLLEKVGFHPKEEKLLLPIPKGARSAVSQFLLKNPEVKDAPLRVVLSPTHRRPIRKWAPDRYVQLAERVTREWGATVIWAWGPGEQEEVEALQAQCAVRTWLMPPTSFSELAAFLQSMELFVGNSNGISHIAVAVDMASLQLHGHTCARSWCPLTSRHRGIQSPEFGICEKPTLDGISFEKVWETLCGMRRELFLGEPAAQFPQTPPC
jgi:heptosyltransferase-3